MKRAYSLLTVKAIDEDAREITGIATTPTTDRMGDIVEPEGAEFDLPIPLLWQHNHDEPIGHVTEAKITPQGIEIRAKLARIDEPGALQTRLDTAWQSVKSGLVRGLSIGFSPIEYTEIKGSWGMRFVKWLWLELSAVTIPANGEATITTIKSADRQMRGASARAQLPVVALGKSAGASAPRSQKQRPKEAHTMNLQDQLKAWEAKRAATVAAMEDLMAKSIETGESLNEEQDEQYEELAAEVKSIDKQLVRLRDMEKLQATKATPVEPERSAPTVIVKATRDREEKFQGQNYTRMVIAKTLAQLEGVSPIAVATERWGKTNPTLVEVIRATVTGGSSASGAWGAELVAADGRFTGDFIEYLDSRTVFNQLPLREVPANVTIKGQDGAATGYWVGESKGIPATTVDFSSVNLTPLKVAALAVVSNELLRDSSPAAEMLVRDALVEAAAQRIDTTFLGTGAASAGVSPAGLLNGVSGITSAGNDGASVLIDVKQLYDVFIAAKNASGLYFVMNPGLAKALQLLRNALGQQEFPGITQTGGTLLGDPVVTGDNVNAAHLILLKPSDIYKIGDGGLQVSMSRDATIEMSTTPTGDSKTPTAASVNLVSMYQEESTAIKVVRSMNFAKRRTHAAQYVSDAAYGEAASV